MLGSVVSLLAVTLYLKKSRQEPQTQMHCNNIKQTFVVTMLFVAEYESQRIEKIVLMKIQSK